jgi:hypothetical protein
VEPGGLQHEPVVEVGAEHERLGVPVRVRHRGSMPDVAPPFPRRRRATADTATAALQQVVAHSESLVRHTGARPRYRRYLANARSGTA